MERGLSPVHLPGVSARWTTSNVDEGLPGIVTPLTWDFYFPAAELASRGAWCNLGAMPERLRPVPDEVDARFFNAVMGRAAANLDLFGSMADRMPGGSAAAMEEQLFGSTAGGDGGARDRSRYPIVAAKAPLSLRRAARQLDEVAEATAPWWSESVARAGSLREAADAVRLFEEARERFGLIMDPHMTVSMVCQGLVEGVTRLAAHAGLDGLENQLIRSPEGTAEFELVSDLRRFAAGELSLEGFLAAHGYHGPQEGLLDAVVWREDPAPVVALGESYRSREMSETPDQLLARRRSEQAQAIEALSRALGTIRAIGARRLIAFAGRAPEWRETGRATILRTVDVGRAAARAAGRALAAEGRLDDPEDVFMLGIDEVARAEATDPRSLVAARRSQHERFALARLPQIWSGEPNPLTASDEDGTDEARPELIRGLGVSAGIGEGRAVVVTDQRHAHLEEGDVLVCRLTDPSWASLFPLAEAVVTDVGSAISHAAIVCRELGIPCVANTRTGSAQLRTGDRVRVDGDGGTVQVLERRAEI